MFLIHCTISKVLYIVREFIYTRIQTLYLRETKHMTESEYANHIDVIKQKLATGYVLGEIALFEIQMEGRKSRAGRRKEKTI